MEPTAALDSRHIQTEVLVGRRVAADSELLGRRVRCRHRRVVGHGDQCRPTVALIRLGLDGPRLRVAARVRLGIASRRHDVARRHDKAGTVELDVERRGVCTPLRGGAAVHQFGVASVACAASASGGGKAREHAVVEDGRHLVSPCPLHHGADQGEHQ